MAFSRRTILALRRFKEINPELGKTIRQPFRLSSSAPSYSSTGDTSKLVTSLGLPIISTMILTGKPNRPLPAEEGIDIEEMLEGGKQAVGVVTELLAAGDLAKLSDLDLVSPECVAGLAENVTRFSGQEMRYLEVKPEDVFFSFVPHLTNKGGVQNLLLVTFSFPEMGRILTNMQKRKDLQKTMDVEMKELLSKGAGMDKTLLKEAIAEKIDTAKAQLNAIEVMSLFSENEIIIGNFRFERLNPHSDWTLVEMGQINSMVAWAWIFRKKWKGRLGISLRGMDFYKVLRADYFTDWLALMLVSSMFWVSLVSGGMA